MPTKSASANKSHAPISIPSRETPLKILFVIAEAAPYASVAGLSRTATYLAKSLNSFGHDARIFMPKFGMIDQEKFKFDMVCEGLKVPTGQSDEPRYLNCNVKSHRNPDGGVITYFLENMEYYEQRANVYGYTDDPIRWALLSRGCLEFLKVSDWKPDVLHANDWHTGFVPNYLRTFYANDPNFVRVASLFTIHNLQFQGMFDHHATSELDSDDGRSQAASFFSPRLMKQNFMRRGIIFADAVNTVSETYALEILGPDYGEGLDKLLVEVRSKLFGVTNGIDYQEYDPKSDTLIKQTFDVNSLEKRALNKAALQKEFGLPQKEDVFLAGSVGRLVEQKGVDLINEVMWPFLKDFNAQLVVVGGGDQSYVEMFKRLQEAFPKKVGCHLMMNYTLPRMVFAGADTVLMPSRFEPGGIVQLESMRYGAVPIVRKTGGLADTVENLDTVKGTGTGFTFNDYDRWAFFAQLVRAYEVFQSKEVWRKLVLRAMEADFSWEHSAREYEKLYINAIQFRRIAISGKGPQNPVGVYEI